MPAEAQTWTCDQCSVTVSWMPEHEENAQLPAHWSREGDELLCLGCRRDQAGELALAGMDEGTPVAERVKIKSRARIEFEINRDPERPDNRIASACHTSAATVRKARERMAEAVAL
jgi:hypothetical protein